MLAIFSKKQRGHSAPSFYERGGYLLLEYVPTLMVAVLLLGIVLLALNPQLNFQKVRNEKRRTHVGLLADAIASYTRDKGQSLLEQIPVEPSAPIEICADIKTGSCTGLLSLQPLIGTYLGTDIPTDPESEDSDSPNEHSRYFIVRTIHGRLKVTAQDTESTDTVDIEVTR